MRRITANSAGIVKLLPLFVLAILTVGLVAGLQASRTNQDNRSQAATAIPNCWPTSGSGFAGTLAGQPNAIWCYTDYSDGPSTAIKGNNTWVDDFNHGLTLGKMNADVIIDSEGYPNFHGRPNIQDYTDFPETGSLYKSQLFRHGNHWMRDMSGISQEACSAETCGPWDFGGGVMSPNKTFRAEKPDGTICTPQNVDSTCQLTIEADAATRVTAYNGTHFWPEFVITTADHPVRIRTNGTYNYEFFPSSWTLGCRLQNDGGFTCALLDDGPGGDTPSRVYELSSFQCGNSENSPHPGSLYGCNHDLKYGGHPTTLPTEIGGFTPPDTYGSGYTRLCDNLDPDLNCRDRWRWEITNNRLTWYANGAKYMEHVDFAPAGRAATNNLLTQPVYVYFGEFVFKLGKPARMHWDRIAINPKDASGRILPPSIAETFCLGQLHNTCTTGATPTPRPTATPCNGFCPTATPTPTTRPTNTPTPTPTPQQGAITVTFNDTTSLSGQYPSGILNWAGQPWHLAGPFGQFTSNSASFTQTATSATIGVMQNRILQSVQVYNGGSGASTITVACAGNTTKSQSVGAGQLATVSTGFTNYCGTLTIGSSNGWDSNFDNLAFSPAFAGGTFTPTPTPTRTGSATPTPTATPQISNWQAQYFNNKNVSGTPVMSQGLGGTLNLNWRFGSPADTVNRNNFSGRFTKTESFAGGTYRFTIRNDDGVRIKVDGQQITADNTYWRDQNATTRTLQTTIGAGVHTITVDYYENRGRAEVAVAWVKL